MNTNNYYALSIQNLYFAAFILLKLTGVLDCSWWFILIGILL